MGERPMQMAIISTGRLSILRLQLSIFIFFAGKWFETIENRWLSLHPRRFSVFQQQRPLWRKCLQENVSRQFYLTLVNQPQKKWRRLFLFLASITSHCPNTLKKTQSKMLPLFGWRASAHFQPKGCNKN